MGRPIFLWISRIGASAALSAGLAACDLADTRPRCTMDLHCGIGQCTDDGFCEDPPLPSDEPAPPPEDVDDEGNDPLTPPRLVCDPADAWIPVGAFDGGVFARAVVHDDEVLLVGGQEIRALDLSAAPTLDLRGELQRRHDAAGVASIGSRLAVVGGEDFGERIPEGGAPQTAATVIELFDAEGAQIRVPVNVDLDQAAWLPGDEGDLIVSHTGTGAALRYEPGGAFVGALSPVAGRRLVQTPLGVLAIGKPRASEPLVKILAEGDADWRDLADDAAVSTWTRAALALDPAGETLYLAGGVVDGELSVRVVALDLTANPPQIRDNNAAPDLSFARADASAVFLPSGELLVIGGVQPPQDEPAEGTLRAPVERLTGAAWVIEDGLPGDVRQTNAVVAGDCVVTVDASGVPAAWVRGRLE